MAADGSIVISAEIDDKQAQKELNKLNKQIQSLENQLSLKKQGRLPLEENLNSVNAKLEDARKQLAMFQDEQQAINLAMQPGSTPDDFIAAYSDKERVSARLQQQQAEVSAIEKEWNKANKQLTNYDTKIAEIEKKLNDAKNEAGAIQKNLAAASGPSVSMERAMEQMNKSANRFSLRLREVVRSALVFTVISQGLASLREWMGKVIKSNDEATAALARLKGALLTLAQPLVNIIIPAFTSLVNILTRLVSAIASVISTLFGTTIEQSAEAAEGLYNETDAIESVGNAAESASKDLASFDEINKLTGESAAAGTGSAGGAGDTIKPDFSFLKDGLLSSLTFTLEDILFDWENLTLEDILAKIITILTTVAGGVIGFTLGGVGGAVIGIMIGAGLGLLISNLTFDGDGKLNPEEILRSILLVLGMLVGGVIGFSVGGPGGAAVGILIGAGVALAVGQLVFNGDGQLNPEEIISMIVVVLGAIAGGVAGFIVGGPGGAAIGVLLGAGIGLSVSGLMFNGDGQISQEEIVSMIVVVLGAIVGGVIGFAAGGPGGALVGVLIGAGAAISISTLAFDGDGTISTNEILNLLIDALAVVCGGLIGFAIGGPAGALIGMTIASGINLLIKNVSFSDETKSKKAGYEEGERVGRNLEAGARDSLGTHSPSTVFEDIGSDTMQGLSNGISGKSETVSSSFRLVLNSLQSEFDQWKINFMIGFSQFEEEFNQRWTDVWNNANLLFVLSWNNILATFQNGINNAVSALNKLVSAANSLSDLTGKKYGHVSSISVPLLEIPKLAQGAVIPPNREFLAVLGDQKQGTNIEAPESLLRKIVREEVGQSVQNSGETTIIMECDKTQFAKLVYKLNKSEMRRIGVSLEGV